MASGRSVRKDANFYKRVIHRSHQRLLEDLYPVSILDLFIETEYIPSIQVHDIQELRLLTEKTREILKRVSSKGVRGYEKFKSILIKSHQEHLAEYLDNQEADLEREITMAQREKTVISEIINQNANFYKRVIHRSHQRLLEDLYPVSILDLFIETEYIPSIQVHDIQELRLSTEKTREILKRVSSKGVRGYEKFKSILIKSHQKHLAEYLDNQEADLEREITMAQREKTVISEIINENYQRVPNEKELMTVAANIGMNWEMLGPFLGIPSATIDQIKMDNSTTILKIYRMLYVWRAMNSKNATFEHMFAQMQKAPKAVNISWDDLKALVQEGEVESEAHSAIIDHPILKQHETFGDFFKPDKTMHPPTADYQMGQVAPMPAANQSDQGLMTSTSVQGVQPSSMQSGSGMEQNNQALPGLQMYNQNSSKATVVLIHQKKYPPADKLICTDSDEDGDKLFSAVAHTKNGDIPGKAKYPNICWFPYHGKEYSTDDFSFVSLEKGVSLVSSKTMPSHALNLGRKGSFVQSLAIADTQWGKIPGKAAELGEPQEGLCWYSHNGLEHATTSFLWVCEGKTKALYLAVINITNLPYTDEIKSAVGDIDKLAITQQLQMALQSQLTSSLPGEISVQIVCLQPGSLIVTFYIHTDGQQTEEQIIQVLLDVLNTGSFNGYDVSSEGFQFSRIKARFHAAIKISEVTGRDNERKQLQTALQNLLTDSMPGYINVQVDYLHSLIVSFHIQTDGQQTEEQIIQVLQDMLNTGNLSGYDVSSEGFQFLRMEVDIDPVKRSSGAEASARPDTGVIDQQQVHKEREVTFRMNQLSLEQTSENNGFGNTRKQGEYQSNEYGPDISRESIVSLSRTNRMRETSIPALKAGGRSKAPNIDQTDAVLMQEAPAASHIAQPEYVRNLQATFAEKPQAHGTPIISEDDRIKKRDERLKNIFDAEEEMKGRLKVLTAENIEDLLDSCGSQPKYKGGFGDIYVSEGKIPGINLRMVVKKVDLKEEGSQQKMRCLTNEKLSARAMHFAIVPLLGIREDTDKRIYYFLSPYMENGNLNQAIEEDNKRLRSDQPPVLNISKRLKIMFQVASAIDFLHTPVKGIRGMILHMDIKSLNIVLDKDNNARLIDFGLAREMKEGHDHTKTTSRFYYATPGYGKLTEQQILARHDDYRSFGVVIRELLTGKKPSVEGYPEETLILQKPRKVKSKLLPMWDKLAIKPSVSEDLVNLSRKCIEEKDLTSDCIVRTLKKHLSNANIQRWESDRHLKKCDMCLEYQAVENEVLTSHSCGNNMNVCISCMRNNYCNPIRCHSCDSTIHPTIGHGWVALLVAGDDPRDSVAKTLKEDVDAVQKVITSKCPLVMGVSADHVQIIYPGNSTKAKIEEAVTFFQNVEDIQTLLVYYSGHYKPEEGGFELRSNKEYLSIRELQLHIANILRAGDKKKRAIVFLDCCSAPSVIVSVSTRKEQVQSQSLKASPSDSGDSNLRESSFEHELILRIPDIRIIQINASRQGQTALLEPGGSIFRRIFLQGLTRVALGGTCVNETNCQNCHIPGDFVTSGNLLKYISKHFDSNTTNQVECVMNTYNADHIDVKIGYVINYKVDLQFTYRFKEKVEHDKIPQRMFCELSDLQIVLFDKYIEKMKLDTQEEDEPKLSNADFREILCIEVEKGPKNHQRDRLTSLDRIMTAWNAKRELVVSLRRMHEISEGMVGVFLSSDQKVQPVLDFLENNRDFVRKDGKKDYATTFVIKLEDFENIMTGVEKVDKSDPSMNKFHEDLIDLDDAIGQIERSGTNPFKELHIVFPCASANGTRRHRRDFMCFQLKKGNG